MSMYSGVNCQIKTEKRGVFDTHFGQNVTNWWSYEMVRYFVLYYAIKVSTKWNSTTLHVK